MGLVQVGQFLIQGFAGHVVELPVYLVSIRVHDLPPIEVQVILGEHEPAILLGRDILNHFRVVLDGPQLALELHAPG